MRDDDHLANDRVPAVDSDGVTWYFNTADGSRWVIHDYIGASDWNKLVNPGSPRANRRMFVGAEGTRRVYNFRRHELRVLEVRYVERQFRESEPPHLRSDGEVEQRDGELV